MTPPNELGLVDHSQPAPFPFGPQTLADILVAGVADHPERLALVDGDRAWNYAQLDDAVAGAASNISAGQVVLWTEPNSAELVIALLATFRAGGIWISTATSVPESVDVEARMSRLSQQRSPRDPFAPALITFTSGTTGRPKSVAHNEHSLLAPGLVSVEAEPPLPGERIGTPLDLRIANIAILGPISAFLRGSTFVVMHRRFAPDLVADIHAFGVTRLFAVPTLVYDMVESDSIDPAHLHSLDRVILGGSGGDPHVLGHFEERFGVRPTLSYGLSEAPTGVVRESLDDPIGSGRGFPLPHIDIVIVDRAGDEVPVGDEGEVCLRPATHGPWANTWTGTLGYLGEPDRTDELFANGVLHTGDLGHLDADGALHVTGRIGRLINRGGKNIDPTAIEDAALAATHIKSAVVVGIPDPRLGQVVGLAVMFDDEVTFQGETTEGGNTDVLDRLDLLEIAMGIGERCDTSIDAVMVVSRWPQNSMGKVDRLALIDAFGPETRL